MPAPTPRKQGTEERPPMLSLQNIVIVSAFVVMFAYSLWAFGQGWHYPILAYGFRQTQTAISVYYILQGGPWLAYETPVLGIPWSIPHEFPLYQWIVVAVVNLVRTPIDQTGRLVSAGFFYLSLVPSSVLLAVLGIRRIQRLVFLTLFLASPLYLFWSRTFMIESTALFLGLAYAASGAAYLLTRRWYMALLAGASGVLAALVKPTTFLGFGVVAVILLLRIWVDRGRHEDRIDRIKASAVYFAALALIPFLSLVIWTHYADGLKTLNPLGEHLTSMALSQWNYGTLDQRLSAHLWIDVVYRRMVPDILGSRWVLWPLVGFLVAAACFRMPNRIPVAVSVLAFVAVILAFPNLHIIHSYYQYANGVFLIAAIGFALQGQLDLRLPNRLTAIAVMICVLALGVRHFNRTYLPVQRWDTSSTPLFASAMAAKDLTRPDDVLLILGYDWSSEVPYYSERRALMEAGWAPWQTPMFQAALANLRSMHIGAVLVCQDARSEHEEIQARLAALGFMQSPAYQNVSCDIYLPSVSPVGTSQGQSGIR